MSTAVHPSIPVSGEPEARALRLAKRVSFIAGLAAILSACLFYPVLGKFSTMLHGMGATPDLVSPVTMALLAKQGLIPTGLLVVAGLVALASSFTPRRRFALAAGLVALLTTALAGTVIPLLLVETMNNFSAI